MYNALEFQKSITEELNIIRNRVRHLIGPNHHHPEDGRYKEAILKNILKRFLPANISVGTGFIVNQDAPTVVSPQLDIIVYDNTSPVLFSEGDFIITTPGNVRAIVEVKTRITSSGLKEVVSKFNNGVHGILKRRIGGRWQTMEDIFLGIFAFEFDGNITEDHEGIFSASKTYLNHLALGVDLFIRKWRKEDGKYLVPKVAAKSDFYNVYHLQKLAFSYFISNLIDMVSGGLHDRHWFAFPIEGTKETQRRMTFYV